MPPYKLLMEATYGEENPVNPLPAIYLVSVV
jgi:hypothetical protein